MKNYIKHLKGYIFDKLIKEDPIVQTLGSKKAVKEFATFYKNYNDNLLLASSALIHETITRHNLSSEQVEMYKKGVADLGNLFKRSKLYMEKSESEKSKKK